MSHREQSTFSGHILEHLVVMVKMLALCAPGTLTHLLNGQLPSFSAKNQQPRAPKGRAQSRNQKPTTIPPVYADGLLDMKSDLNCTIISRIAITGLERHSAKSGRVGLTETLPSCTGPAHRAVGQTVGRSLTRHKRAARTAFLSRRRCHNGTGKRACITQAVSGKARRWEARRAVPRCGQHMGGWTTSRPRDTRVVGGLGRNKALTMSPEGLDTLRRNMRPRAPDLRVNASLSLRIENPCMSGGREGPGPLSATGGAVLQAERAKPAVSDVQSRCKCVLYSETTRPAENHAQSKRHHARKGAMRVHDAMRGRAQLPQA